jgi:hypothetical protein
MRKKSTKSRKYKASTKSFFRTVEVANLFRIYAVLRRLTSGVEIPEYLLDSKWGTTVFKQLQTNLLEHQKATGLKIDPIHFIRTHFLVYGKDTYPTHLIAHNSFDIYRKYREQCTFVVSEEDNSFDVQMRTLDYLAEVRKETREQTVESLRNEGLFTEAFIEYVRGL